MNLWDFLLAGFGFTLFAAVALVFTLVLAVALFLLLRSIVGRSHAIRVTSAGQELDGVPFYTKRGRFVQETTYLEALATVTLTAKKVSYGEGGKATDADVWYAASKTIRWPDPPAQVLLAQVQDALDEAAQKLSPDDQLAEWFEAERMFRALTPYDGSVPADAPLVGNRVTEESFVDYDRAFYLNAAQPLIGSANLTTKLAADGTLSESTATIEESTLATMLGALPAGEWVSAFPTPDFKRPAQTVTMSLMEILTEPQERHVFSLELERRYVRHILSEDKPARAFAAPIALSRHAQAWYRREYVLAAELDEDMDAEAAAGAT